MAEPQPTRLKCGICGLNKENGKFEAGVFICEVCAKKQAKQRAQGVTRYDLVFRFTDGPPKAWQIVKARYKESNKRWTKLEADPNWPHYEAWQDKSSWRGGVAPGFDSPQAAVTRHITNRYRYVAGAEEKLRQEQDTLNELLQFARNNGFEVPETKAQEQG